MNRIYLAFVLLLLAMLLLTAWAIHRPSVTLLWGLGGLAVGTVAFLCYFHQRVMRPMHVIGNGMELLREQDFGSRLRSVGEPEADRIVDIFNQMMTELKEERLRLLERNRLLNLLVEVSPMGVVMLDFDGRIASLNPAAIQFLDAGTSFEGKTLAELGSDLARKTSTLADGATETFKMSNAHIYRCTRSSFIDRGFPHPFVLIESLTLDVMNAEREAYGKVIRMIAHEVNNTMAAVGSVMETVGDELCGCPATEPMGTALRACADRSHEMSAFITRFANVVRIPEPTLQEVPLNSLVTANAQFFESLCRAHDIQWQPRLCEPSPVVAVDVELMTQVLGNIVKNSIESIAEQGQAGGTIVVTTTAEPATLVVEDNGAGIAPATESKLFTPFFSTKPHGHGIGLLLIREVLTLHRFQFSLKTESDGKTRFRIHF